jgi:hypothetical protein
MPEIGIGEEFAHFAGANELAEFQSVFGGGFRIIFGGRKGNAMAAGAESYAEANVRKNIPVSSE